MPTKNRSRMDHDLATVKAYTYGNTIVVKYFDSGAIGSLQCPFCQWTGDLTTASTKSNSQFKSSIADLRCPDCNTKLAKVSEELLS